MFLLLSLLQFNCETAHHVFQSYHLPVLLLILVHSRVQLLSQRLPLVLHPVLRVRHGPLLLVQYMAQGLGCVCQIVIRSNRLVSPLLVFPVPGMVRPPLVIGAAAELLLLSS